MCFGVLQLLSGICSSPFKVHLGICSCPLLTLQDVGSPTWVMCKSLPGGTGIGSMKAAGLTGSWKETDVWHCERSRQTAGGGAASAVVEAPGMKGLWMEAEAWHHVAELESQKRSWERLVIKVQLPLVWRSQNIVFRRALRKLSGRQDSPLVQGSMIRDIFDPTTMMKELLLSNRVFKFTCIKLGEVPLL